jgi:hypothetical protein
MLLAEELALVAVKPESGRHELGAGEQLNASLAGLLVAELILDGAVGPGDREDRIVAIGASPVSPALAAATHVVTEKGPKIKAVLSHMSRGLQQRLGTSTWDTVVAGLEDAGILGAATGTRRARRPLLDAVARESLVDRLRAAAAGDGPLDSRTALLLSMTGPAQLLEVVAPSRSGRRHARERIDHALDGTELAPVAKVVRRLVQEAAAAASVAG